MKVTKIEKHGFEKGLNKIRKDFKLFAPVDCGEYHEFKEIENGEKPDLEAVNTHLSPKSAIYPQSQPMFNYTLDENEPDHHIMKEVKPDLSPRAIFGIRPCDAKSFLIVRRNFDTEEYKDPYWIEPYEAATFVGMACSAPCSTCFCTTAGCGPFNEEGLDLLLIDAETCYYAKAITDKGEKLLETAGWLTWVDEPSIDKEIADLKTAAENRIESKVGTDRLAHIETNDLYNAPIWEDVSFACINCGTCTYVCPTCWCFDIQDENCGSCGIRMRNWDSCMFPLFTKHGTGHNPRETKIHRVRQRFMHKLKYYVDKYDTGIQCVGCGRCIRSCPVNIDIRNICELMNNHKQEACAS